MPAWLRPRDYPLLSGEFVWESYHLRSERATREISCPFWALLVFFLFAGTIPFVPWARRRRRRIRGLCEKCGYDLRGSPERCPECGPPDATVEGDAQRG
jgi:hypothetical protein